MNRTTQLTLIGTAVTGAAFLAPSVLAGGIQPYEIATPDVGLASAGYAARADGASTVFKKTAGMSRLDGTQIQAGLQLTYGSVSFSPDANASTKLSTDDGADGAGLAYQFMWGGTMVVDQGADPGVRGRVSGSFDSTWFSFLSAHLTWKFESVRTQRGRAKAT